MPIIDLYKNSESRKNLAHFAAMASLASVDGEINPAEKKILDRFAEKLGITAAEYKEVMKKENKYPVESTFDQEERLERLYDFFRIVFADNDIEGEQIPLVEKYAVAIGFPSGKAGHLVQKSVDIFRGRIPFEDYKYLMDL
jgi:uncharacterized tellurite resistance protein B-like protein